MLGKVKIRTSILPREIPDDDMSFPHPDEEDPEGAPLSPNDYLDDEQDDWEKAVPKASQAYRDPQEAEVVPDLPAVSLPDDEFEESSSGLMGRWMRLGEVTGIHVILTTKTFNLPSYHSRISVSISTFGGCLGNADLVTSICWCVDLDLSFTCEQFHRPCESQSMTLNLFEFRW